MTGNRLYFLATYLSACSFFAVSESMGQENILSYSLKYNKNSFGEYSGNVEKGTAGEDLGFGDPCYIKSDGKWWLADADSAITMPVTGVCVDSTLANETCIMLIYGTIKKSSWSWTVGGSDGIIYMGNTKRTMVQSAPSGVGDQVQVIGVAKADTVFRFIPNPDIIEIQ
jgi:hypothetical protein